MKSNLNNLVRYYYIMFIVVLIWVCLQLVQNAADQVLTGFNRPQ